MYKKAEQKVPTPFGRSLFKQRDAFGNRENNVKYLSQHYGTSFPDYWKLGVPHVGGRKANSWKLLQPAGSTILPVKPASILRDQTFGLYGSNAPADAVTQSVRQYSFGQKAPKGAYNRLILNRGGIPGITVPGYMLQRARDLYGTTVPQELKARALQNGFDQARYGANNISKDIRFRKYFQINPTLRHDLTDWLLRQGNLNRQNFNKTGNPNRLIKAPFPKSIQAIKDQALKRYLIDMGNEQLGDMSYNNGKAVR